VFAHVGQVVWKGFGKYEVNWIMKMSGNGKKYDSFLCACFVLFCLLVVCCLCLFVVVFLLFFFQIEDLYSSKNENA
jgi:hypothetical protein